MERIPNTSTPRQSGRARVIRLLAAGFLGLIGPVIEATLCLRIGLETNPNRGTDAIEVIPVQGSVYLIAHAGANIAVHVGKEGLLVVDAGVASMSDQILAALKRIALANGAPATRAAFAGLINTSADADHTGGNESAVAGNGELRH